MGEAMVAMRKADLALFIAFESFFGEIFPAFWKISLRDFFFVTVVAVMVARRSGPMSGNGGNTSSGCGDKFSTIDRCLHVELLYIFCTRQFKVWPA